MAIERIIPTALALLLVAGSLGYAQAKDDGQDGRDAAALAGMKVTLTQAIAAAEQQAGGKAVGADVSQQSGTTRIAVEVPGPQGVKTVLVAGQATAAQVGRDNEDND